MKFPIVYRLLLLILIFSHLMSCKNHVTIEELEKYVLYVGNGTRKSFESGDFKADLVYRPTDLMVKQELNFDKKNLLSLKKNYEKYNYFVLNLQNNGGDFLNSTAADKSMFIGINEQLSFNLNEHVYALDENKDTAYLVDFAFPRLYEAAKSTSVLLAFKANAIKTNNFKICLKDIGYTKGIIEFDFDKKDLQNIPSLKL